jgi:protein-tyrosine phosphatase
MTKKLLFVCLGNICRSPAAEGTMNHLLAQAGLTAEFFCDSAGTAAYHVGNRPDARMIAAADKRRIHLPGRARQFGPRDFEQFDLILAMDRNNFRDILAQDPTRMHRERVRLMCEFCQTYPDREVPDPYYGGEAGFEYVLDLLNDACGGLLKELIS